MLGCESVIIEARVCIPGLEASCSSGAVGSLQDTHGGRFTSEGHARFDMSLRAADARRGIRDFEAVDALARGAGLSLRVDRAMPAENRWIPWHATRRPSGLGRRIAADDPQARQSPGPTRKGRARALR
jgi:hypothetical protein